MLGEFPYSPQWPEASQMPQLQTQSLRLVEKTEPSNHQTQETLTTSCDSSTSSAPDSFSWAKKFTREEKRDTLGNKLQRLAFLNPKNIRQIELLVDHLLKTAERSGRGFCALALFLML